MKHLIDKDALVAEIKRIKKSTGSDRFLSEFETGCNQGKEDVCDDLRAFLDTLEVKEVDINKEISQFIDTYFEEAKIGYKLSLRRTARHFYELGLKAQKGE